VLGYEVLGYGVMGYEDGSLVGQGTHLKVLGYDVLGYDVLGYDVLGYDVLGYDVLELWGRSLLIAQYEIDDCVIDEVGLLPHEEVAGLLDFAEGEVGEEVGELVAPGEGEDGVAVAPED